jgi:hypothetical protein
MIMCIYIYLYMNMIIHMYIVHESHIGITKCFLFPCIYWPILIYRLDMVAHKQCSVSMKDPFAHTKEFFCGKQHKKWCLGNRGKWDTACFVRHSCLFKTLYHQAHHHTPHHLGHRTWWWTSAAKDKWWVGIAVILYSLSHCYGLGHKGS